MKFSVRNVRVEANIAAIDYERLPKDRYDFPDFVFLNGTPQPVAKN
jgi:hypothetical protein